MTNFCEKILWLFLFSLIILDGSQGRSDLTSEPTFLSIISKKITQGYQISPLQNAMLFICLVCLMTGKPFDIRRSVNSIATHYDLAAKTVVGAFLTLVCSSVFLPIYLILLMMKKFVEFIVYWQYGNTAVKATGTDIMWGTGPSVSQPFITVTTRLDGCPDMKKIKEHLNKNVLNFENADGTRPFRKFKQIFHNYYGYFFWKDCQNFGIDHHVKLINLTELYPDLPDREEENHYLAATDKLVCQYASDFGFKMLPANQPQWEINFLKTDNEKSFILYFKLHHAIGDGMSLLRLLLEHVIDSPVKISMLHKPVVHPFKRFLYTLWSLTFIPFTVKFLFLGGASNPLHGKTLSGNKILVTSDIIPLGLVKKIKDKTKTTVIDVLLSCISFSIANHFQRRSSSVEKINMFFPIGFEDANVPISLCNKFTVGITTLPTLRDREMQDTIKEPTRQEPALERLFEIKKSLDEVKRGPTILAFYYITSAVIEVLPLCLAKRVITSQGLTLSFSNVPGPQHELFAFGNKITEMRFWVPDREPNGCGMTIMSYNRQMRLGLSVDKALIASREEAEMIVDDFGKQLFKLSQELKLTE